MFQPKSRSNNNYTPEVKEFEEKVVQVSRVSKKTTGGNKISFSVLVVIGDKKGRASAGHGQAPEVQGAIKKAVSFAKKHLITVPMRGTTIPHEVLMKYGAAKILLKPAPPGSGVIAGGSIRAVVEAAGIKDISGKILGTNNKANNVYATIEALKSLKSVAELAKKQADRAESIANAEKKVSKK